MQGNSKKLHQIIKERLKQRGLILEDLFLALDISRAGYGKAINSKIIKLSQLETIADYLQVPLPELLLDLYYDNPKAEMIKNTILFAENIQKSIQKDA